MNSSKIFSKKVQTILLSVGMVLYSLMPGVLAAQSNWVPPTGPPPNNNAPRPFHQGLTGQAKYYSGPFANATLGAFGIFAEALVGTYGIFDGPGVVASNYCFGDVGNFSSFPGNINSLNCISEDDWLTIGGGDDSYTMLDGQNRRQLLFWDTALGIWNSMRGSIALSTPNVTSIRLGGSSDNPVEFPVDDSSPSLFDFRVFGDVRLLKNQSTRGIVNDENALEFRGVGNDIRLRLQEGDQPIGAIPVTIDSQGTLGWDTEGSGLPSDGGVLPLGDIDGEVMVWRSGLGQWETTNSRFVVKPWSNAFELGTRFFVRGVPQGVGFSDDLAGSVSQPQSLGNACSDNETLRVEYISGPTGSPTLDTVHEIKCTDLVRVGENAQFTINGQIQNIDFVDIAPSDFLVLDSENIYIQTDNNSNFQNPEFDTTLFPASSALRSILSTKSNGFATWRTPITIFGDSEDAGVRIDNSLYIGELDMLDEDAFETLSPRPLCYVVHPLFGNKVIDCDSLSSGQEVIFDTEGALECLNIPFGVDKVFIDAYAGGGGGGGGGHANPFSSSLIGGGGGGGGSAGQSITDYEFNVPNNALNPRICVNVGSGGQGGPNGFLTQHVNVTIGGGQQVSVDESLAGNGLPGGNTIVRYQDDNGTDNILISLVGGQGGFAGQYVSEAGGPDGHEPNNQASTGPLFGGKGGAGALGTDVWWHNGGVGVSKFSSVSYQDVSLNQDITNYIGFAAPFPVGIPSGGGPGGVGENPHAFSVSGSQPPTTGDCHYMAGGGWENSFGGQGGCSPDPQNSPGAGGGGGGGARGYFHITTPAWLTGYDYTARVTGGTGGNGSSGRVDITW